MNRNGDIRDHVNKLSKADINKVALVGIMDKKTYPDGELVAQVGYWNEYGTATIPPRPFFRTALDSSREKALEALSSSLGKGNGAEKSLLLAAEIVKNNIVSNILTWRLPPNAQSTIRDKGFNAPLRGKDRLLRNSVTTSIEGAGND